MPTGAYPRPGLEERFWAKVDKSGECWNWTAYKNNMGYGMIRNDFRCFLAHRVSWELSNGPIPKGLEVCHRCDNPLCVNPIHLFLGTHQDNFEDAVRKERFPFRKGEANGRRKLTWEQVRIIRRLYAMKIYTQTDLAEAFGVRSQCIWSIVHGENWETN